MMNLYQIYRPITSTPFQQDEYYTEYEPCAALKPFIRCFWSIAPSSSLSAGSGCRTAKRLVIPDTCMDIIFYPDPAQNQFTGVFHGIDDTPFISFDSGAGQCSASVFAIRFYAWTAVLFADDSMRSVKNQSFDLDCHFPRLKRELSAILNEPHGIKQQIAAAEHCLLKNLKPQRENALLTAAITEMILHQGTLPVNRLAAKVFAGNRQLERIFKENIGLSPKKLSSLIRYQYLWNEVVHDSFFQPLDKVFQFGYTDQAHLINDFKRFHSMSPNDAKIFASKDVAFFLDS